MLRQDNRSTPILTCFQYFASAAGDRFHSLLFVMLLGPGHAQLLTDFPSEPCHPRKISSALENCLHGWGPCLKRYPRLVSTCLHGPVHWKRDTFTLDVLKQTFSAGKASKLLLSMLPWAAKAGHSSWSLPPARALIPGPVLRRAINKPALHLPVTEETPGWHQPVWDQLFPRLWSPRWGLSQHPGCLLRWRYRLPPADSSSKAHCGHRIWGGDHLSKWLVTTPPWQREAFLMRGRW